jgi:hypothetical protein
MITLFLNSSVFSRFRIPDHYSCKLSFRDINKKYHNKRFQERLYTITNISENYRELSSLLLGLKNIKIKVLEELKLKRTPVKILRIVSSLNGGSYISTSLKQLFDSWEYLDFRGVPYSDLWREVYNILLEIKNLDIQIIIKNK